MNSALKVQRIDATNLSDLWFQAVYNILDNGRVFKIDQGSFAGQTRLEFDYFFGHVHTPGAEPLLPEIPPGCGIPAPVEHDYVFGGQGYKRSYIEYLMTPTRQVGEAYTYGDRLTNAGMKSILANRDILNNKDIIHWQDGVPTLNQIELAIYTYKKYGHRNNQIVLQIAQPSDMTLQDPPCLRHIDTRIQDNKLHFFVYFRSWDLWSGMPANLAAIQTLKEYMAGQIGVDDGEMIVESKGLHLYGYAEKLAKLRCFKEL